MLRPLSSRLLTAVSTTVFTDGACLGNPGPGGWAWAVPDGPFQSGASAATTNQRMEITAALEAARSLEGVLEIVSDSTYVVNCFRDRWWEGWIGRGWVTSAKKPVANRDLWEPLIDLYRAEPGRLRFRWVKGHSADRMNDLVDRLAVEAARRQEGRSGTGTPAELGPADDVRGAAGAVGRSAAAGEVDPRVPEGRKLVVVGLKPDALGGYDDNLVAGAVRSKLAEILFAKQTMAADLVVLTGLGLGAEQLAAEAALDAHVPYVAVLPFPDQEAYWPVPSRLRYLNLLTKARSSVLLQARAPESKAKAAAAFARRDAWLARHADEAVVVWDGRDELVGRSVRSLQDHLGEDEVWIVEP
jgi:ribonuclease HI/uncharacterized phage-like protein YoqJ